MPCKVFDEIIYPFSNFNGFNCWRVDMDKYFHHTRHNGCNYHVNTQSRRQYDKAMFYYSRSKDGFTILWVCLSRIFLNQIWIRETMKPLPEADSLHDDVIKWKTQMSPTINSRLMNCRMQSKISSAFMKHIVSSSKVWYKLSIETVTTQAAKYTQRF